MEALSARHTRIPLYIVQNSAHPHHNIKNQSFFVVPFHSSHSKITSSARTSIANSITAPANKRANSLRTMIHHQNLSTMNHRYHPLLMYKAFRSAAFSQT